jgi:hypothetical protein
MLDDLIPNEPRVYKLPVIVSPARKTFKLAAPVKLAVIVPAAKLLLASLNTIVSAVFTAVAFELTVNVQPSVLELPLNPFPLTPAVAT